MHDENIDWSWTGKSNRVFATIWGKLTSFRVPESTIDEMKRTVYTEFDKLFKDTDYNFVEASEAFISMIADEAEAVDCGDAQIRSLGRAVLIALDYNLNEDRGNR